MTHLLDTDHISILQRGPGGADFTAVSAHVAEHDQTDLAFCVVSLNE